MYLFNFVIGLVTIQLFLLKKTGYLLKIKRQLYFITTYILNFTTWIERKFGIWNLKIINRVGRN